MSTAELKNYLHKVIVETDDKILLAKISEYVQSLTSTIPKWQEEVVNERLEEYKKGTVNSRSWEEAKKDIFKK